MNTYKIRELYYTLQGEGMQSGRAAVFLRFTGCNLWSGREEDRADAVCNFCDTDFLGTSGELGGRYTAEQLALQATTLWPDHLGSPYIVCTGGEPLLQLDKPLIDALHEAGFEIGLETNGTLEAPAGIDWICVSPKAKTRILQQSGDELKLVVRQPGADPEMFENWRFQHFLLQPMDGPFLTEHMQWAIAYCLVHPRWRLSVQLHKMIGVK